MKFKHVEVVVQAVPDDNLVLQDLLSHSFGRIELHRTICLL